MQASPTEEGPVSVDSNQDGAVDFQVTLVGVGVPAMGDYIF